MLCYSFQRELRSQRINGLQAKGELSLRSRVSAQGVRSVPRFILDGHFCWKVFEYFRLVS